ncbi:MAG: hypothetical protein E7317_09745 [Clostridiales bacterium]|nr:hypothetical protein [Clostridiales bacterium]
MASLRFGGYKDEPDDTGDDYLYDDQGYEDREGPSGRFSSRFSSSLSDDYADDGYDDDGYDDGYQDEVYEDGGYADDGYDDGYEDGYDDPYDSYADDYAGRRGQGNILAAIRDYVDYVDWPTYVLLFLLPPLGIFLLWRRNRFEPSIRFAISAASAVWFVILILLLATLMRSNSPDRTIGSALPTPTPGLIALQAEATLQATSEPELSEQPTATAVSGMTVPTAQPGSLVWTSQTGTYYHSNEQCPMIGADESSARVTLENAQSRGKYACPTCYGLPTYYTNAETEYYHADPTCSGLVGGTEVTADQAEDMGKQECPVCVTRVTDKLMKVVQGATKLVDISTTDESNIQVWFTDNGVNFHTESDCRGMTGARQASLKEALLAGKTACETCCASAGRVVYCTRTGTYYHADPTCSGMTGASDVTIAEALVLGKEECPTCKPNSANLATTTTPPETTSPAAEPTEEKYVYATEKGQYYHTDKNCSGMKNASRVPLSKMLEIGRPPCPVCCEGADMTVYASEGGTYYHSYSTCSGMSSAKEFSLAEVISAGYQRCPRCWGESVTTGIAQ